MHAPTLCQNGEERSKIPALVDLPSAGGKETTHKTVSGPKMSSEENTSRHTV